MYKPSRVSKCSRIAPTTGSRTQGVSLMSARSVASLNESDWLDDVTPTKNIGGRPAKGYRGRQRKLECESCGFIVYATAGAVETCEDVHRASAVARCIGRMS